MDASRNRMVFQIRCILFVVTLQFVEMWLVCSQRWLWGVSYAKREGGGGGFQMTVGDGGGMFCFQRQLGGVSYTKREMGVKGGGCFVSSKYWGEA